MTLTSDMMAHGSTEMRSPRKQTVAERLLPQRDIPRKAGTLRDVTVSGAGNESSRSCGTDPSSASAQESSRGGRHRTRHVVFARKIAAPSSTSSGISVKASKPSSDRHPRTKDVSLIYSSCIHIIQKYNHHVLFISVSNHFVQFHPVQHLTLQRAGRDEEALVDCEDVSVPHAYTNHLMNLLEESTGAGGCLESWGTWD